jgi:porphobilinogen synthase
MIMILKKRPRRLRKNQIVRDLVSETTLDAKKLIMPYFVCEENKVKKEIESMPGIFVNSLEELLQEIESDYLLGVRNMLLFGLPKKKDPQGSGAYAKNGIIQKSIRKIKKEFSEINLIGDVCLCEYTSHGHCGQVDAGGNILNDATLKLLAKVALAQTEAGVDWVAPSDMMDGRVAVIREVLDKKGFVDTGILSYAVKYASAFYGPFRDAADSAPQFGDRSTYQMDFRNSLEAEKEACLDVQEGADIIMVKPALSYLDVIYRVKQKINLPVCAYNVSGSYSMVKTTARQNFIDEKKMVLEILTSIFRAGADLIVSYHTRDVFKNKWF